MDLLLVSNGWVDGDVRRAPPPRPDFSSLVFSCGTPTDSARRLPPAVSPGRLARPVPLLVLQRAPGPVFQAAVVSPPVRPAASPVVRPLAWPMVRPVALSSRRPAVPPV